MSNQSSNHPTETDTWPKRNKKSSTKGKFRLEYRVNPEHVKKYKTVFPGWFEWTMYYKSYKTEKARETALGVLTRNDKTFEYRIPKHES